MKRYFPLFVFLMIVLVAWGAQNIVVYWYSQAPQAASLNDNDICLLERPAPHTNLWFTLAQLKAYVGTGGGPVAPNITSFSNNRNVVEIGSTVNSTVLTWTLNGGTPTSQSINQGIGAVAVGTLTVTDSSSYTTTRTYTLTESNSSGSTTASTSVTFESKRYWGPSALTSLTDAQVRGLSQEFATGFVGFNHNITCNNEYMYFAFPVSFGVPLVNVDGLLNSAWVITTDATFQNAAGYVTPYYIYRSLYLQTGTHIVQLVP